MPAPDAKLAVAKGSYGGGQRRNFAPRSDPPAAPRNRHRRTPRLSRTDHTLELTDIPLDELECPLGDSFGTTTKGGSGGQSAGRANATERSDVAITGHRLAPTGSSLTTRSIRAGTSAIANEEASTIGEPAVRSPTLRRDRDTRSSSQTPRNAGSNT
jgi:hypothetical protein